MTSLQLLVETSKLNFAGYPTTDPVPPVFSDQSSFTSLVDGSDAAASWRAFFITQAMNCAAGIRRDFASSSVMCLRRVRQSRCTVGSSAPQPAATICEWDQSRGPLRRSVRSWALPDDNHVPTRTTATRQVAPLRTGTL